MAGIGNVFEHYIVDTSADVDLANDNTLNDDAYLIYPVAASEDVHFDLYAFYIAIAGGIKAAMSGPAGFTSLNYSVNIESAGAVKVTSNVAQAWDVTAVDGAGQGLIKIHGHLHNGVNAGNLVFRWCQNVSHANLTTIYEGSSMRIIRY